MAYRFTHEQLATMAKPASDSEEERMEHARSAVYQALQAGGILSSDKYEVFAQGSYANNTNVRNYSDVDINVCYTDAFYFDLPYGVSREEYGFTGDVQYSYSRFKDDIESMLVSRFGRNQVQRKNKCLHVVENTYRAEIDVVPTWLYRNYKSRWDYNQGVALYPDNSYTKVINYPKQHLENGIVKNNATSRRFKKTVRIVKNLKYKMESDGYYRNDKITSFLIESLIYNLGDGYFNQSEWNELLKVVVDKLWYEAYNNTPYINGFTEVSERLPLFGVSRKWTVDDVRAFFWQLWNYLGCS